MRNYTATELKRLGGNLVDGRVYFSDLEVIYGISYSTYKTGAISSATLRGESISNSRARGIVNTLSTGKLYFDLATQEFTSTINNSEVVEYLIAKIDRVMDKLRAQ